MTGFTIPSGVVTFNAALSAFPSMLRQPAQQSSQDQAIPLTIDWGNSGGSGVVATALDIDIGSNYNGSKPFQLVQSLFIDNVECRVDVRFIFAETGFVLTVPAGSCGVYPVVSLGNRFYVVPLGAFLPAAGDFTNITAFNYNVPPFSIEKTIIANAALVQNLNITAGTTALIPAGVTGTLEGLEINLSGIEAGAGGSSATITIQDGSSPPVKLATIGVGAPTGTSFGPADMFDQSGMNLRFVNGINIVITTGGGAVAFGVLNFNAIYH